MAFFKRKSPLDEAPEEADREINCPGFAKLVGKFSLERKYRILDLGRARAANIEFFNQYRCRLYIADLVKSLHGCCTTDDVACIVLPELDELAQQCGSGSQDLVLCWDLFNYLSRPLLTSVTSVLAELLAEGGHLHAYIHTKSNMPDSPADFEIVKVGQMRMTSASHQEPAPRYAQRELERLMPGLKVRQSHLLQSGLQEYLLTKAC